MVFRLLAAWLVAMALGCAPAAPPRVAASSDRVITFLAVAEMDGTTEPCGCNSQPLGDVARVATLLHDAQYEGDALFLDAGGLRHGQDSVGDAGESQARLKDAFLEETWRSWDALRFEEVLTAPGGAELRDLGGIKVGVFAVLDYADTARKAVDELHARGARIIVALIHASRADAKHLVRAVPGITLAVVGKEVEAGSPAEQVENTILVQPAARGEKLAWVEFHVSDDGRISTQLVADRETRMVEQKRAATRLASLQVELARIEPDPAADPAYVAARKAERANLLDEKVRLDAPARAPAAPYARARLVPITRSSPRDARTADALSDLDSRIGLANRLAGEKAPVPQPPPGAPCFVGNRVCGECHDHEQSWTFWKGTSHAKAWAELVRVGKQWSHDCIRCHVTGYGEAGGSAMGHVEGLVDVGCETCHGPGSSHSKEPKQVHTPIPVPDERLCKTCHTPERSDTFQFDAYLRDILGAGHGEERRRKLGMGVTGKTLRQQAMEKAESDSTNEPPNQNDGL